MKKSIKVIFALFLLNLSFVSCTNNETDEELQLFQNQELTATENDPVDDDNPPPPPPPPPSSSIGGQ